MCNMITLFRSRLDQCRCVCAYMYTDPDYMVHVSQVIGICAVFNLLIIY